MKIGVVQFHAQLGKPEENARQARHYIERASEQGCRLVLFPEMCDTGYEMETIKRVAQTWDANGFLSMLQEGARANNIYVVSGLSERVDENIFNAVVAINPSGQIIGSYRKIHLFTGAPIHEERYLKPGSDATFFQADEFRCGIMVCYDLRFPELARFYATHDIQLLLIASAFPFPRENHWETLVAARAIENQIFVAAANRTGQDAAVTFCGSSRILDPFGTVLASCTEAGEHLIVADIQPQTISDIRSNFNTLRDRRPDIYRSLEQ